MIEYHFNDFSTISRPVLCDILDMISTKRRGIDNEFSSLSLSPELNLSEAPQMNKKCQFCTLSAVRCLKSKASNNMYLFSFRLFPLRLSTTLIILITLRQT